MASVMKALLTGKAETSQASSCRIYQMLEHLCDLDQGIPFLEGRGRAGSSGLHVVRLSGWRAADSRVHAKLCVKVQLK